MKKSNLNLKPCPYCKGRAYIELIMGNYYIECFHDKTCLVKPNTWLNSDKNINKQIKGWNKRIKEE